MNKVSAENSNMADYVKWLIVGVVLVAACSTNVTIPDQPLLYRGIGILAMVGAALGLAYTTAKGRAAWQFIKDSRTEVRRVVWPARQETVQTTFVVVGVVLIMSVVLWVIDSLLFKAMVIFTG